MSRVENINPEMKQLLMLKDKITLLNGLSEDDIISIVDEVKIFQYNKDDIIIQEGSKNDKYIYILLKGRVEVKKVHSTSEDRVLAEVNNQGVFGEISALTNYARSATIISTQNSTVLLAFTIKDSDDTGKTLFYKNVIGELSNKIIVINGGSIDKTSLWDL